MKKGDISFETKVIHVGNAPDEATGAVIPPIYQSSTYAQKTAGKHKGYEYTRTHNPTRSRLEECLASLENAKYCLVTASGLSATELILQSLPKDSKILCGDDVYGGTYRLFTSVFGDRHNFVFVDTTKKDVEKIIASEKPQLIWLESPTNPMLKISDIKKICVAAKKSKAISVVDNTFMGPFFQNPLDLGADIAFHSLSKYINGHSDVIAGALMLNNRAIYEKLFYLQNAIGPCQSPFDSWLVLRGVKTLAIRMQAHEHNAFQLAKWLEKHPLVESVLYPGLKSHPQHHLAKRQMSGYGGMITFFLKGGLAQSKRFLSKVKLFKCAESLGGVESLIEHPAIMTHASVPKKIRQSLGISDNLIRLSAGIECFNDLKNDLEHAFEAIS